MKKLKWTPVAVVKKTTATPERFEQLLAETAEILYKRLSQQVQVEFQGQKISTEPALIIKKAASS